jgi:hypothetical protein
MNPNWITTQQILDTRGTHIYIYGDDKTGKAYLGQGEACAGYSNCYPIWTRVWPCRDLDAHSAMWNSYPLEMVKDILAEQCFKPILQRIKVDNPTVIILPKIGMGCAKLHKVNKPLLAFINEFLDTIRK